MNKRRFVRERREAWRRFDLLVNRLTASRSKLAPDEIAEFSRLFRELSNDLAILRSRGWGTHLESYLNDLVARGHNAFYSAPPGHLARLGQFLAVGFPRMFRANIGYFLTAAVLFFVPGAISWGVIQYEPALATRVLPSEVLEQYETMYGADRRRTDEDEDEDEEDAIASDWEHDGPNPWGGYGDERSLMAGFYVRHNVGIALTCFAHGVLLGVGTVWMLLYNGIAIGATGGYLISQGASERFLSFVVSHGSFELMAIAVAGGGGLILADSLLHPGQRTRLESLRVRGLVAVQFAGGAAAMLMVAALIEAFWSPAPVPALWKYSVGAVLWLLVFLYLGLAGHDR